jgi:hypothetical protein
MSLPALLGVVVLPDGIALVPGCFTGGGPISLRK